MKKLILLLLTSGLLQAQTVTLSASAPSPVTGVSVFSIGPLGNATGTATYCYHIMANFPIGKAQEASACISQAPNVLDTTNHVKVVWNALAGALGYDVVRTPTAAPVGQCTSCLLVANGAATSFDDNGLTALTDYNRTAPPSPVSTTFFLDNMNFAVPGIMIKDYVEHVLCIEFPDADQLCTGGNVEFGLPADFAVGTETLNTELKDGIILHGLDWNISADIGTMPVGSDAIFDVQVSHNQGATWSSVFPAGTANELVVHAGGSTFGTVSIFAIKQLIANDWIKVVCIQKGSGTAGKGLQGKLY